MKIFRILGARIHSFVPNLTPAHFSLACLLCILLAQSSFSLFLPSPADSPLRHDIDIIIRTASASIFGYFLSNPPKAAQPTTDGTAGAAPPQLRHLNESAAVPKGHARIGFSAPDEAPPASPAPPVSSTAPMGGPAAKGPVLAATGIALFCLLTLMLLRSIGWHQSADTTSALATAAQFRDFISGCIGFLIGCARTETPTQLQQEE